MKRRVLALFVLSVFLFASAARGEAAPRFADFESALSFAQTNQPMHMDLEQSRWTLAQLRAIRQALPKEARLEFSVYFCKQWISSDAEEVDLNNRSTGVSAQDIDDLLTLLPHLRKLVFSRHRALRNKAVIPLIEAYPEVDFVWLISLGNKYSLCSDATAFSCQKRLSDNQGQLTSAEMEPLRYASKLKALDLGHQCLTSLDFLSYVPDLHILILADNDITDVAPIAQLHELEYLELFRNKFSDLTPLSGLENLRDLNLCFLPLENADLSVLSALPKLERFWCNQSEVGKEEQERFVAAHPGVEIHFQGTRSTADGWREHPRYKQYRSMFAHATWVPFQ